MAKHPWTDNDYPGIPTEITENRAENLLEMLFAPLKTSAAERLLKIWAEILDLSFEVDQLSDFFAAYLQNELDMQKRRSDCHPDA